MQQHSDLQTGNPLQRNDCLDLIAALSHLTSCQKHVVCKTDTLVLWVGLLCTFQINHEQSVSCDLTKHVSCDDQIWKMSQICNSQ